MTNSEFREICLSRYNEQKDLFSSVIEPNIETYRKGDCTLRFTDADGKPLKNAKVKINQSKHDFKYGANIFMLDEFPTKEENDAYRDLFHKYFNLATVPFYWAGLEPEQGKPRYAADSPKVYRRPAPDLCLEYCNEHGIDAKLHCMFYDKFIPDWLPKQDEKAMKELYEKRFKEIADRYRGKMYEFEVTNELLSEWTWDKQSCLCSNRDVLDWAFNLARKYLPNETLVINEGDMIHSEVAGHDYRSRYFLMIEGALQRGVSIDKIGMQHHIFCGATGPQEESIRWYVDFLDPSKHLKGFSYLSEFGKPLEITETTIPTLGEGEEGEQLQAEMLEMLYTVWFSIPQMESIVYWNTIDNTAYVDPNPNVVWSENDCRAGLFRRDFTPKPAAKKLWHLFNEKWHTDLELTTDENGSVCFRGFYGDYAAEVNGRSFNFGLHKFEDNDHQF